MVLLLLLGSSKNIFHQLARLLDYILVNKIKNESLVNCWSWTWPIVYMHQNWMLRTLNYHVQLHPPNNYSQLIMGHICLGLFELNFGSMCFWFLSELDWCPYEHGHAMEWTQWLLHLETRMIHICMADLTDNHPKTHDFDFWGRELGKLIQSWLHLLTECLPMLNYIFLNSGT